MTKRQIIAITGFSLAVTLMLLCQVISFGPGVDVPFYLVVAGLSAFGFFSEGRKLRIAAGLLFAMALFSAFGAHRRGIEYLEWRAKKYPQSSSQKSISVESNTK